MTTSPSPELLTVQKAVEYSGFPRTRIYDLAHDGKIDARKLDGRAYILRSSLDQFISGLPKAPFVTTGAAA